MKPFLLAVDPAMKYIGKLDSLFWLALMGALGFVILTGCVDQDTFGLLRRQLPNGFLFEKREGSTYYFELSESQSVLVSELGWNATCFVGKIDHQNDWDKSPEKGKVWAIARVPSKTLVFLSTDALREDVDCSTVVLRPSKLVWEKLPPGPPRAE